MDFMIKNMQNVREMPGAQEFSRAASTLGTALPGAYIDFLTRHNGGRPQPDSFPMEFNGRETLGIVDVFFCLREGDSLDILAWAARYHSRLPKNMIAIALDPGGNLICMSLVGKDEGRIYFWDHENEATEGESPWLKNLTLISNDLEEFLSSFV